MSRTNHKQKAERAGYGRELWSKRSAPLGAWGYSKYYRKLTSKIERMHERITLYKAKRNIDE